jgi:hypothetical protein
MGIIRDTIFGNGSIPETSASQPRVRVTGETPVAQANSAISSVNKLLAQHIEEKQSQASRFTPDGLSAEIRSFANTPAARAVDEYEHLVDERVSQAEARAEQVRRGLSPDHDTAGELRAQRALDRAIRKWDTHDGGKLAASVREDLLNADPTELAVLAREAAPYLESRGVPSSFVGPVLAEKVPELAQAEAELKKAKQAQTVTHYNANTVRNAIREGRAANALADASNYDPDGHAAR